MCLLALEAHLERKAGKSRPRLRHLANHASSRAASKGLKWPYFSIIPRTPGEFEWSTSGIHPSVNHALCYPAPLHCA